MVLRPLSRQFVAGILIKSRPRFDNHARVHFEAIAELATQRGAVKFVGSFGRTELKGLHEAAEHDGQQGHGDDASRARASARSEGQELEIVSRHFHAAVQEALRVETLGLFPVPRVVGEPPRVHVDAALRGNVVAGELRGLEVQVGEEQWDNHVQAHHLLHKRAQVGQLVVVRVGFANQVAFPENGVELISNARL